MDESQPEQQPEQTRRVDLMEWDQLASPIEFRVDDPGKLHPEIASGVIQRTGFDIEISFSGSATRFRDIHGDERSLAGEISAEPPPVLGRGLDGTAIRIIGPRPTNQTTRGDGKLDLSVEAGELAVTYKIAEPQRLIDWVINFDLPPGCFLLRLTDRWTEADGTYFRERDPTPPLFDPTAPLPVGRKSSRDHALIEIALGTKKVALRVGRADAQRSPSVMKPGFLEYSALNGGIPSEDERDDILTALSFVLGRQLVRAGTTTYDADWNPIHGHSRRVYLVGHLDGLDGINKAPTGLTTRDGVFIDEQRLGDVVSAMLRADFLNLRPALWTLWVGERGLLDNATGLFGAALEAVRSSYFESKGEASTLLLQAEQFKPVRKALEEALRRSTPKDLKPGSDEADAFRILTNKIAGLNARSSSMQYPEFLERLGLPAFAKGGVEDAALRERNGPAHGRHYRKDQYPALMQVKNALLTLFHRCVLKAAGASETYIDYSTIGWPSRKLEEPLGGPRGDGKPAILTAKT